MEVGVLELNRNPENYFAEVEQAAFEPGTLPPGLGASPDKMLQARLLSYPDAHCHRIGVNYAALDVNKPRCPVRHYHRDGHMRFDGNGGGSSVYEPNSFRGPAVDPTYREPPLRISGDADRWDDREGNDDYQQAGHLYRLMSEDEKARLIANIVGAMEGAPRDIQLRQARHFFKADPAYGKAVAQGLGMDPAEIEKAAQACGHRDVAQARFAKVLHWRVAPSRRAPGTRNKVGGGSRSWLQGPVMAAVAAGSGCRVRSCLWGLAAGSGLVSCLFRTADYSADPRVVQANMIADGPHAVSAASVSLNYGDVSDFVLRQIPVQGLGHRAALCPGNLA